MERDAGLAPERTDLAWRRTALSAATCGTIVARHLLETWGPAILVGCAVAVIGTLGLRAARRDVIAWSTPPGPLLAAMSGYVLVASGAALGVLVAR